MIPTQLSTHNVNVTHAKNIPACVAGVQKGGREEVEFEREARSLGPRASRSNLTSPSLPFVRWLRRNIQVLDIFRALFFSVEVAVEIEVRLA